MDTQSKKERGRARYEKQKSRVTDQRSRSRRTRGSDVTVPRITDGIPANHQPQVFTSGRKPKPMSMDMMQAILQALDEKK